MPIRSVTIVPHIENLELRKDTGQVPYHFFKTLGYDAALVTYFYTLAGGRTAGPVTYPPTDKHAIEKEYPYSISETPGLKLHFLPYKGRGKFYEKAIYQFLAQHSKEIDLLNLFHFSAENIFYTLLYKYKNPHGKVYLKLDIDIDFYKGQTDFFNVSGRLGGIKKVLYNKLLLPLFFKKTDLISAESQAGMLYFGNRFKRATKKLILVPNGIDRERALSLVGKLKPFEEKENIILTVGRIGNVQKNHEFLLSAIPHLKLGTWKVYFAGPVEPGFQASIDKFFTDCPAYKEKVIFTGNITDPAKLYGLYNRAKVFCMPSKWEGFPLAAVEAACFGNILLMSESIYAYDTLTDNGKNGYKIKLNDISGFAHDINRIIADLQLQKKLIEQSYSYSLSLSWNELVIKISKHLAYNTVPLD